MSVEKLREVIAANPFVAFEQMWELCKAASLDRRGFARLHKDVVHSQPTLDQYIKVLQGIVKAYPADTTATKLLAAATKVKKRLELPVQQSIPMPISRERRAEILQAFARELAHRVAYLKELPENLRLEYIAQSAYADTPKTFGFTREEKEDVDGLAEIFEAFKSMITHPNYVAAISNLVPEEPEPVYQLIEDPVTQPEYPAPEEIAEFRKVTRAFQDLFGGA